MKLIKMKVESLKYAPYNPRRIAPEVLEDLENSIKRFGYVEPIVVNEKTKHVVGGNQRLKVLRKLGIEEVEAVIVSLNLEEEKLLSMALNKISGNWDIPLLQKLMTELNEQKIDLEVTGFDQSEIDSILNIDIFQEIGDSDFPTAALKEVKVKKIKCPKCGEEITVDMK